MKKLLLLLLVMTGMVSTASAKDYVVAGNQAITNCREAWNNNSDSDVMTKVDDDHYYLIVPNCNLYAPTTEYSNEYSWQVVEKGTWDGYKTDNYGLKVSEDGTYTLILIVKISTKELTVIPVKNLTLSNNYGSNNTWNADNSSFYFSYISGTKWAIDVDAEDVSSNWRFRIWTSGILSWDGWHNIAADSEGQALAFATSSDASHAANDTNNSWEVEYPSYSFDKYTISAEYDVVNYKWVVKADAYIKKTISSEGYATFGSAAPVDFSNVSGLTAQKGKVGSDGKITFTTATTLAAGEGALLSGDAGDYYIPVAASASADQDNEFVAITTNQQITETMNSKNAYILAKVNDVLGFYKPAEGSGSWCAAGTAYLATSVSASRGYFPLWDDATAIETAKQEQVTNGEVYNLAGQRIAQPTKGLYIVNGKKVFK